MGEIKSAMEIAMEKIEKLGSVSEDERLGWKYIPEGKKLAARYIKGDSDLDTELKKYEDDVKKYVIEGAGEILVKNINLPKDDSAKRNNKQAMNGLKNQRTSGGSIAGFLTGAIAKATMLESSSQPMTSV